MFVYSLLDDNIKGENFKHFLLCCLHNSTYVSVTISEEDKIISEFKDYIYKSFETYSWYCYKTYETPLFIMMYHSTPSLLEGLVKYFDCLFPKDTKGIEDLCFFKDNRILFGSVTHERIAQIVLSSETDIKEYEKFAAWKETVLSAKDYAFYPDLEKLY